MTAVAGVSRKLFVPETVQTSAMDCGPASLRSLLEGCGIPVSYGRLREACQTDVDGTSIDTMEEVAIQLGLGAEQVLIPADHLLLQGSRALPAIVVVKRPSGETHFVVVWRRHGQFVQVMDPATGRKWLRCDQFKSELYQHVASFPASAWRKWAGTPEFIDPLRRRMRDVGLAHQKTEALLQSSLADASWKSISILDAGVRMVASIISAGGLKRSRRAGRVLEALLDEQQSNESQAGDAIPAMYHSAFPKPDEPGKDPILVVRGAVAVRVTGPAEQVVSDGEDPSENAKRRRAALSPELAAALEEKRISPTRQLLSLLCADGFFAPGVLLIALALAAAGIVVEALLFRGLLDIGQQLGLGVQRYVALIALLVFAGGLMLVEIPIMVGMLRWGRRLEVRLRAAFLKKLPRLSDRYFKSRPVSDMAERCHSIQALRMLPNLGGQLVRSVFAMLLTTAGLIWLDPGCLLIAGAAAITAIVLPLAMQPLLAERDLRMRTHVGALGRFYLDSLLGLVAVRTHAAEPAIRREHHNLLSEWMRAGFGWQRAVIATECVLMLSGLSLAAWLVFDHISRGGETATVLLLVYWALSLPAFGEQIALLARQYPSHRNLTGRLMEPLRAPEEKEEAPGVQDQQDRPATPPSTDEPARGVAVVIKGVEVKAGGHTILRGIDLTVAPGEHVAVLGASGAGKSTLVGLLLGWHRAAEGTVLLDGAPPIGAHLDRLRRETAWVDPSVQIWNDNLLNNLTYGTHHGTALSVGGALLGADLLGVLRTLPDGLQTRLGEGGGLVSGGEGQRVRLARALMRPNVRLVILDEPFRGLDHESRLTLLSRAREWWRDATLICITHDVGDTNAFDRVVVLDHGRIAEQGDPETLAARSNSHYSAMLAADREIRRSVWAGVDWRRFNLDRGKLCERKEGSAS